MLVGRGQHGRDIFDLLLKAGVDPHRYAHKGGFGHSLFKKKWACALGASLHARNMDMVKHFMTRCTPRFDARMDQTGFSVEAWAAARGIYEAVVLFAEAGAQFDSIGGFGNPVLACL